MKQREIQQFFSIRNAESVDGEMYLEGISEPGAPNKRGLMLDAATSWPYIEAYIAEFEARTGGASKGALRAMHDERREVGKIVNVDLSQSPAIPVRVHVVSDEAKKSVEARVLNAFSWNWAVVGSMWEDKDASKQFGRKVMKYTGRPIELSLVDAPGIPETGFHVVANFDEGEDMSEPVPAPAEKPEAEPAEVKNAEAQPETVANGLYTAGRFGEALEGLAYIQRVIAGEESAEGDATEIPDDLKAAIGEVAKVYAKYATAQAAELIEEGEDFDLISRYEELEEAFEDDLSEGIENGDYPGHPFRGNQHKKAGGRKSTRQHDASRAAAKMSAIAKKLGGGAHASASANHAAASKEAAKAGKKSLAAYHANKATHHAALAGGTKNADAAAATVKNSDDSAAILAAISALGERIAALEVANSDRAALVVEEPARAPAPVAVVVPHDSEQVANSDKPAFDPSRPYTFAERREALGGN